MDFFAQNLDLFCCDTTDEEFIKDVQKNVQNPQSLAMTHLAQQLLVMEGTRTKTLDGARDVFDDMVHICEKLRAPLAELTGVGGYSALLSRSLALAKGAAPSLGVVRVRSDGILEKLDGFEQNQAKLVAENASLVLLTQLLELLVTFIGKPIIVGIIYRAWPEGSFESDTVMTEGES